MVRGGPAREFFGCQGRQDRPARAAGGFVGNRFVVNRGGVKRACSRLAVAVLGGVLWAGACGGDDTGPLAMPAAVGRPEGASQGPRVAVVVAARGGVTIVPRAGDNFVGETGRQLLRDDTIVVGAGGFAVIELYNHHLVRLKPNERYVVEMIAGFHDPPAGNDLEARFLKLLGDDADDDELRGAIGRVAGWNTRLTAAETIAPLQQPPSELRQDAERGAPADDPQPGGLELGRLDVPTGDGAGGAGEVTGTAADRPKVDPKSDPRKTTPRAEDPGDPAKNTRPTTPPTPTTPPAEQKKAENEKASDDGEKDAEVGSSSAGDLPDLVRFKPASGGAAQTVSLPRPLKDARKALAQCAGAGATIVAQVKGHKLVALTVGGQPRCEAGLIGQAVGLDDGAIELRVTP